MVRHHHRRNVWIVAAALVASSPTAAQDRAPLTNVAGDPLRGLRVVVDSEKGNCVICHAIPGDIYPADAAGDLGPPLDGVGKRYSVGELRQRVADPKAVNPATIMPGYFVTDNLHRVQQRYTGLSILTAQEIEDVVAYLTTLQ